MLKKIIVFCFLMGTILFAIPPYRETVINVPETKPTIEKPTKVAVKKTVKRVYKPPTGEALEIAQYVAKETGHSVELISKIMWAESQYRSNAINVNRNKSTDYSWFQVNSIHIPTAQKMGLDITNPKDNVEFAIYLIKKSGLSPWNASKKTWSVI